MEGTWEGRWRGGGRGGWSKKKRNELSPKCAVLKSGFKVQSISTTTLHYFNKPLNTLIIIIKMAAFIVSLSKKAISVILRALFSPLVTGPVLLLSTTTALQDAPFTFTFVRDVLSSSPWSIRILQGCFTLGILRKTNSLLNTICENNWQFTSRSANTEWDFSSEIAVVTGGSSGIGLAIARALSSDLNIRAVAVLDLNPPSSADELEKNERIHYYHCDITSPASIASAAAAIHSDFSGAPSILVNNAGIGQFASILDVSESHLRDIVNVNLLGLWFATREFLPGMIRGDKGHVITIASLASFVSLADSAHYAATKAGALAFHEGLVVELRKRFPTKEGGVVSSVVHPTWAKTAMTEPYLEGLKRGGVEFITAEQVADEVVGLVKGKKGKQVVVPRAMGYIMWLRAFPGWMQTGVRELLSVNKIVGK